MARTGHGSVGAYIAAQPLPARSVLRRVRAAIRKALPGATEGISYRIPAYKLGGRMVLYFASFRHHYSIYPATARVKTALKKSSPVWRTARGPSAFPSTRQFRPGSSRASPSCALPRQPSSTWLGGRNGRVVRRGS